MSKTDPNPPTTSRCLLVWTALSLLLITAVLRLRGFRGAVTAAAWGARFAPAEIGITEVETVVETASGYLPFDPSCLVRSLVATTLLPDGADPALRIGVDPSEQAFSAHAWVEVDGRVVVGELPDRNRFQPLPLDGEWP